MAKAISTQNIQVTAFGLENQTSVLESDSFLSRINIIPRTFRNKKSMCDDVIDTIALSKLIRNERPDIVHVNALQDLLSMFVAVHLTLPGKKRPAIIAMTHSPLTWKNPRSAWFAAQAIRLFADGCVSLATTHKQQLLRLGLSEDRITVIPNPYDAEQIKQIEIPNYERESIPSKAPKIVYVAYICERKAQDILIRAANLILKKHPHARFDFVGGVIPGEEAYAESLNSLSKELDVHKQVHFSGPVSYQKALELLATGDIFAFPSRSEMMPRAVIEAMLAGKPVVASGVDGILDLIENRRTGILVQPGNIHELADAICELIEDLSLAKRFGMAGREYVLQYCSPERVGRSFLDFYQAIRNQC
jgi:glycosyltransferase involved in cell wall biosynthesis